MRHAITYGARHYNWPSIARASFEIRKVAAKAKTTKRTRPCQ